jgi:hypothetical protein
MAASNQYTRTRVKDSKIRDRGPYEAIIVSHLDPLYMGTLEVEIIKYDGASGTPERSGQLVNVRYLSPFYGVTPSKGLTPNDGYEFTQKSYGMWAVPPDVGTRVLVVFAEGSAAYGYWIGCIQDVGMNFMLPDGRAVTENTTPITPANIKGTKLPVGEYNKLIETGSKLDPTLFEKPYNKDFTETLEVQGLILDEARGTTTTSARREAPSMVFGISTPGPLDKRNGNPKAKYGTSTGAADVPYNRLGGSSFVMDDGDDKFIRNTHASDGPPVYINREAGESGGDETIPQNELTRIRTRTGHQILLHNSEDLIYIGNARGTAWLEMTSDGKIDIYARDSISLFSDNDINLTASRDFNVDAGRNINMKATARYSDGRETDNGKESGRVQIESAFNTNMDVGKNYKLTVKEFSDTVVYKDMKVKVDKDFHLHTGLNIYQTSDRATHHVSHNSFYRRSDSNIYDIAAGIHFMTNTGFQGRTEGGGNSHTYVEGNSEHTVDGYTHLKVTGEIHTISDSNIRLESTSDFSITTADDFNVNASSQIHLLGGSLITGDASEIHWNSEKTVAGPTPVEPAAALRSNNATPAEDAQPVTPLTLITLPYILPGAQTAIEYESILTRAPQHEPWPHHENANPYGFKPEETDREEPGVLALNDRVLTVDTFRKNMDGVATSNFVTSNAYSAGAFTGSTGDGNISQDERSGSTTTRAGSGGSVGTNYPPGQGANTQATFAADGSDGPLATITTSKRGLSTQVAAVFAADYQGFIDELEATGYEITKLGGYSKRRTVSGTSWSVHASGGAIDINWPDNVMGGRPNGFFKPRPPNAPITDMPVEEVRRLCAKYGLGWGGDWRSLDDAMHFSKATNENGTVRGLKNGQIPLLPENIEPQQGETKSEDAGGDE